MLSGAILPGVYKVLFSKDAHKYYQRLPSNQVKRIDDALADLSHDPYQGGDIRKLKDMYGYYRLRVGDLRVIFEINEKNKAIWIDQILPRGQAYK